MEGRQSLDSADEAKYNYSTKELDRLGEVLLEADEIRGDDKLFRLVQQRLGDKADRINSIKALRDKMANEDITPDEG